jgi:hypothetical protein
MKAAPRKSNAGRKPYDTMLKFKIVVLLRRRCKAKKST